MIKQIFWRKLYGLNGREREPYWENVQCTPPRPPERMTPLFAVVKELDGHTVIHEYKHEEDTNRYFLLASTHHHVRDHLFNEFYETGYANLIRTHRRLVRQNNRSHVHVYTLTPPEAFSPADA